MDSRKEACGPRLGYGLGLGLDLNPVRLYLNPVVVVVVVQRLLQRLLLLLLQRLQRLLRMLHMLQQLLLLADAVTSALLAPAALLPVLAHAAATALLAIVALPPGRTGARRREHCGEGDGPRGTRIALLAKLIADRQVVIWGGGTRNEYVKKKVCN